MHYHVFSNATVLDVRGKHAQRYLNARLSNDIRTVTPAQSCLAASLSPQGKVEAVFTVCGTADGGYLLFAERGDRAAVIASLKRFLAADRVEISDLSERCAVMHCADFTAGDFAGIPANEAEFAAAESSAMLVVRRTRLTRSGVDLIIRGEEAAAAASKIAARGTALDSNAFTLERIKADAPLFPDDTGSEVLPMEAGLARAVSSSKGCYAGQEVVEKLASHGKAPRVLRRLVLDGAAPMKVPTVVASSDGKSAGEVTSCAADAAAQRTYCFALLKNREQILSSELSVDGRSAAYFK